ncbi:MAG TPA: RluA family pseudouridine synthase [Polyangia bacterium]|jgi:Pseudouridylate synthases, 23S RNA-specific|nr:RluA family pseudouridine synthase [Polyangia bacterium]
MRFVVGTTEAGLRLDAFLLRQKVVPSATAARRAIAEKIVLVAGRPGKKGQHLSEGQVVEISASIQDRVVPVPAAEIPLVVLFSDDDLVVVDKPAGLPSHPLRAGEGPSAAGALVARFPECAVASPDPREGGLVQRLDRGTTGVLVAARRRAVWPSLRDALAAPDCEKTYLAEVVGRFPDLGAGEKDFVSPGARPGTLSVAVPIGRIGRRGARVKLGGGRQPLPAITELALVEQRSTSALIEARLCKGRTHQVRAHLAYLGIPVLGDTTYGDTSSDAEPPALLHLHAAAIVFKHPTTGQLLRIEAPLPTWARLALQSG